MNTLRQIATTLTLAFTMMATPIAMASQYTNDENYDDPRFDVNAPPAYAMVGDLLIARPLGLIFTAVGTGVFVVTLPFSALGGNVGEAADALVVTPAKTTFVRCLGCTEGRKHADEE
ncbi:multidrug transporter [Gammaproteobacteria bacterium ESL0073]|nr:multidrug transporter [Gammaproteobacteria bacterium ESL0073]